MVMELKPMQATMDSVARRHIDFIKSRGEKGVSAIESLATLERLSAETRDILEIFWTEYYVIEALASAMKAEIERMEEES